MLVGRPRRAASVAARLIVCSGEALPAELARPGVRSAAARSQLHNLYGPTEAAIDVDALALRRRSARPTVPIGRPIWNTRAYVLDAGLEPGAGRRGGRAVHRRRRAGARLSRPPGPDRGAVRGRPVRRCGRAAVPHRRPGALARGRRARVPRPRRRPGEDARLPHRAGRDRGGAGCAARGVAGGGGRRARTAPASSGWSPTWSRGGGAAAPDPAALRRGAGAAAAGLHGAGGDRGAGRAAADAERQARPPRAAGAGAASRRGAAGAAHAAGGAAVRAVRRGAGARRGSASTTTSSSSAATRCWPPG